MRGQTRLISWLMFILGVYVIIYSGFKPVPSIVGAYAIVSAVRAERDAIRTWLAVIKSDSRMLLITIGIVLVGVASLKWVFDRLTDLLFG